MIDADGQALERCQRCGRMMSPRLLSIGLDADRNERVRCMAGVPGCDPDMREYNVWVSEGKPDCYAHPGRPGHERMYGEWKCRQCADNDRYLDHMEAEHYRKLDRLGYAV